MYLKNEDEQKEEDSAEKQKRQRSLSRHKNQPKDSTSSLSDGREVKFVTFVAKIKEISADELLKQNSEKCQVLEEKTVAKIDSNDQQDNKQSDTTQNMSVVTDNYTETSTLRTENVLECLHKEINECECCKCPRAPSPSFVNQGKDIFHLTYVNDDKKNENSDCKNLNSTIAETVSDQDRPPDLREILLSNYDPKYAERIGINEFVPVQIMTPENDGQLKNLEFIPFESIDSRYPK